MFEDRVQAGKQLAERLGLYHSVLDAIVLGLPRGGVILAQVVAQKLNLPLDIIVAKKLNPPGAGEFAIGAVAESGEVILDPNLELSLGKNYLDEEIAAKRLKIKEYLEEFRPKAKRLKLKDRTAIIVDDGIATGYTMLAAVGLARSQKAKRIIVAVPVLPNDRVLQFQKVADEFYYLEAPENFLAIGQFYGNFPQVENQEVLKILREFNLGGG